MPRDATRPALVNASHFHCTVLDTRCTMYCALPSEVIPLASFEDGLNPACYRDVFHPFSQVIKNTSTGECLLVRDHLGVRPLYYYYQSGRLIFGDTIPDIIRQLPSAPALLDSEVAHLFGDVHYYTDNTPCTGIKRVEPGHIVHIFPDGRLVKLAFWQLEREGDTLHYHDERDYLEHFTSLLQEAVQQSTQSTPPHRLAAEFSAGMDSTAVYGACASLGLNPTLFMHAAPEASTNAEIYNDTYEHAFMTQFPSVTLHRIMADDFEPLRIFKDYATWFGGASPYIFEVFAHNLHKAVASQGHQILLSGFGGDQGVSSHIPARFILPELMHHKHYRKAWAECSSQSIPRRLLLFMRYAHPGLHHLIQKARDVTSKKISSTHPYHRHYFKTLREVEWSFLQGPNSHEIRMRIEYSSIVAKKMGFEYRYPLLYPKLLEFFLSLPLEQKRSRGRGRYLMRRYLARLLPGAPFQTYTKKEGLHILPATMHAFQSQWGAPSYQKTFQALPHARLAQDKSPYKTMIKSIQAFMLHEGLNPTPTGEIA